MKKVKDSRKRWKQLVTMLLVTALLVTGTPDIVGLASEGTQEQVTTAADQSEGTQAEGQAEAAQEEEAISEEPVDQQDTSAQQDTAAKQENIEKNIENRSTADTTERSENSQNSHEKDKAASGVKSGGFSTSKVRETEKNTKKEDKDTKTEYTYRGSAIQAKVTLKDAEDLSDEADLRVKQTTVANKIKTQIINKAVGEENTQLVDSVRAYDLSFILNGESVTPSGSMQVTLANLGTKSGQNTLIYQVTDDGQVKNTDAVRTGSDAMQFAAKSLCTYVVLTYTTVSDVNGNDITTLYPAMVIAAQTQLESKEDGNVPVESWTRTNTPLVLKDTTGKKALAWTWSDIAGIDLSLDNDSQIWNGSRSYGKHTSTSLKNGRVTAKSGKLYDSALWKNEGKAGKDTTITRIRGEFTITDKNKNNYAYTLKPVTDSENIYAKDNMFVFVYPKDVELTDDNYMDYLAFWTGSSADAGEKERTFHGRTASNYTQRTPVENVSVLTDGWHMTAASNNAGSIIASTDASDYYVDVISTTDSSNGGMYRFKLVKEKKEKTQFTFRNLDTNAKTGKGGAVFELYKDGVHYSAQSENEEGRVTFNIVKPEGSDTDVYTLKETKAPEGYDKITTTWKVLVSSEGVTMVKDTEGNEMPKYPDGTYVVSSAKTDEADNTEQTAKTPSVIREYKSDDVNVTVTAENEADLPADAKLVVKPIELSQKAQENVEQAAIKEEKKAIKNILAYDIHFEADGKEVQPGATVKVSVDVPEIKAGANASVFHVDDKNKVENMDGEVDKKGNVVFETTHFSQYVIVNRSQTNKIKVTIHHYQYGTNNKIYADDVKTLDVGASISDYTKAKNWVVEQVILNGAVQSNTDFNLTSDSTIDVYYYPTSKPIETEVAFYDYTLKAGQVNSSMDYSKTATVIDWDKRTYKIDINASSKATSSSVTEKTGAADIMMVFDMSGSMNEDGTKEKVGKFDDVKEKLDKTKVYYYNTSGETSNVTGNTYYTNPMIYIDGAWRYYNGSEWKEPTNRDVRTRYGWPPYDYGQVSTWNSRITALKEAAIAFIKDTAKKSPKSKIGIATFDGYETGSWWNTSYFTRGNLIQSIQEVGSQPSEMIKNICKITADGGTSPQKGLEKAKEQLNSEAVKDDKLPKNIILFTDGVPSYKDDTEKTETIIGTLKNEATIFTVALSSNNEEVPGSDKTNVEWMKGLATDEKHAFSVSDSSELGNIFQTINETITQNINIENATITDVIDPRFVVVNDNDGDKYGTVITNEDLKGGKTITLKNGGVVSLDENGNQVVTWTKQTIKHSSSNGTTTTPGWSNTITVKAKDDFIGGNKIITNGSESGITLENVGTVHFEQPAVNVKLLDITHGDKEITVFLGDKIDPANLLKQLNEEQPKIIGFEKDSDGALKNYNIPESSRLKPSEISKLLNAEQTNDKQPSISKPYSYGNTQDNVGEFVYTIEVDNDKKTSHNTTTAGVKVEQYKLHVEYVPYTMYERNNNNAPGTLSTAPGTAETDEKISDNYYYVNVVAGKIQLIKKLDSDTPAPDSDKTFEFNVEYTAPGGTASERKQINLIVDKVTKISGEEMVVYGTPDSQQLPRGTYVIKESLNPEYKLKNIENSITSTTSTSEGSQSVTKTTNCYNEISNPITDDSSITFMIGTDGNRKVIGKDEEGNVTGLDKTEIEKTTSEEGVVTAIKAMTAAEGYATFTNEARLSTIHIKKVDADGTTPLEGAKFTLKKKGTEAELQNITTNKNGKADFTGIAPGSYQITEVQSPAGYTLLANPIEVSLPYVTDSSKTDITTSNDKKVTYNGADYYYEITYNIKNNKLFNMPASGGRFKATLIGIAVMIMAAGCYILRHRRKRII